MYCSDEFGIYISFLMCICMIFIMVIVIMRDNNDNDDTNNNDSYEVNFILNGNFSILNHQSDDSYQITYVAYCDANIIGSDNKCKYLLAEFEIFNLALNSALSACVNGTEFYGIYEPSFNLCTT